MKHIGPYSKYDLRNRVFGNLLVVEWQTTTYTYGSMWHVKCICGDVFSVKANNLVKRRVRSCGKASCTAPPIDEMREILLQRSSNPHYASVARAGMQASAQLLRKKVFQPWNDSWRWFVTDMEGFPNFDPAVEQRVMLIDESGDYVPGNVRLGSDSERNEQVRRIATK